MKAKFTFFVVFVASFLGCFAQQVPNGGFETWTDAVTPTGWVGLEDLLGISTNVVTFKDVVDYAHGTASLELVSDSIPQQPHFGVATAEISLGTGVFNGNNISFSGVASTARPDSLEFTYKYTSPGTDTAVVVLNLTNGYVTTVLRVKQFLMVQSNWTRVAIPLSGYYLSGINPDTALLQFKSSSKKPVKGSTLHIDGVKFAYAPQATISAIVIANGPTTFCGGDSVTLSANTGNNYTYLWYLDGNAIIGEGNSSLVVKNSGSYTVTIDSAGFSANSQPVVVTVNQYPVVFFTGLNDTVCRNSGAVVLSGGNPAGGTYSGTGVIGTNFMPQLANLGVDTIVYSVAAGNCVASAWATITVNHAVVSLTGLNNAVCRNANALTLSGGSPAGGVYSGSGVTGSTFNPQLAALGIDTIVYTATDGSNCSGSATATITVNQPAIYLTGLNDTMCSNAAGITLTGGSPAGGIYSESGVTTTIFNPQSANLGIDTIVYTATDANNCTGSASETIFVELCSSIDELSGTNISIYPNPATGVLHISSTDNLVGSIFIYDETGRIIESLPIEGFNNSINIDKLANGTYIYKVMSKEVGIVAQNKFIVLK